MSNRVALAGLAIGCMAAAAGGGYLATRQNAVPAPAAAQTAPVAAPATAAPTSTAPTPATSERPVQETEALVGDSAAKPAAPAVSIAPKNDGKNDVVKTEASRNTRRAQP